MQAWRHRVLITAGAAAMAATFTSWFVSSTRNRRLIIDEAEMAEAAMERYAAQAFATNATQITGWTNVRFETNGARAVWGGYSNVTITIPAAASSGWGDWYNGNYLLSGRRTSSYDGRITAHRGWVDVYTNTSRAGRVLVDLGPSGGSIWDRYLNPVTQRVGGWALWSWMIDPPLMLPPGKHINSAWFMERSGNYYADFEARTYSPADCTATPGGVDPSRATYWTPVRAVLTTNAILTLPIYNEIWYTNFNSHINERIPGTDNPRMIMTPNNPWLRGAIPWPDTGSGNRHYIDPDLSTDGDTDFDGWPWDDESLPLLATNAEYVAYVDAWNNWATTGTNTILQHAAFLALGNALKLQRILHVPGTWTNGIQRTYESATFDPADYGDSPSAAYAALVARPSFSLTATTNNNAGPEYALYIGQRFGKYYATLYTCQSRPVGMLGLGHNTNGHNAATAHVICKDLFKVPVGETLVRGGTHELASVKTDLNIIDAVHVFDVLVPATAPVPPPSSFWPSYAEMTKGTKHIGFDLVTPVIVTWPAWRAAR